MKDAFWIWSDISSSSLNGNVPLRLKKKKVWPKQKIWDEDVHLFEFLNLHKMKIISFFSPLSFFYLLILLWSIMKVLQSNARCAAILHIWLHRMSSTSITHLILGHILLIAASVLTLQTLGPILFFKLLSNSLLGVTDSVYLFACGHI